MKTIHFVRHASRNSSGPTSSRLRFESLPLTPEGQHEAFLAGQYLQAKHGNLIDLIALSGIDRAQQTADGIGHSIFRPRIVLSELEEFRLIPPGKIINKEEAERELGKCLRSIIHMPFGREGVENVWMLIKRFSGGVESILNRLNDTRHAIAVTHGIALMSYMGDAFSDYTWFSPQGLVGPCTIVSVTYDEDKPIGYRVITEHLPTISSKEYFSAHIYTTADDSSAISLSPFNMPRTICPQS